MTNVKSKLIVGLSAMMALDISIIVAINFMQKGFVDASQQEILRFLGMLLAPPALYLLSSMLPEGLKTSLVFLRTKFALPGHQAFSKYVYEDSRINLKGLKLRVNPFPQQPEDQQAEWYRIYRRHVNQPAVEDANRRYLFFRELTAVSMTLAISMPIVLWMLEHDGLIGLTGSVFVVQFVFAMMAAQHAGIRLVKTVLAIESAVE